MERKERARRVRVQRERMKGWQTVWDACMKAAGGGNDGDGGGGKTTACEEGTEAAKDGRDEDKNDVLPF